MSEDKKTTKKAEGAKASKATPAKNTRAGGPKKGAKSVYEARKGQARGRKNNFRRTREKDEFEQKIVDLARVTRVMKGGKRMRFRACVAVGDKKGRVGVGVSKGLDVTGAISKAVAQAKKDLVTVPLKEGTIPHEIRIKRGASRIMFRPAKAGHGVIAGGVVRVVLDLAGVKDITSKIYGGSNKLNNAMTTLEALRSFVR